jgi:hypothetical protein
MPEVFELRVHGVGGTPPEGLLGEPRPGGLVRVGGDGKSAFFARLREGRKVEGYAWGPLTSSGLVQPLWIFLLPFTMLNIAGWMLPPKSEAKSESAWNSCRILIALLGVGLTLDYVYGLSVIIIRQVMFEWVANKKEWLSSGDAAIWIGTGLVAVIGFVTFVVATRKRLEFEAVDNPVAETDGEAPPSVTLRRDEQDRLGDEDFWASKKLVKQFLWIHVGLGAVALAALAVIALLAVDSLGDKFDWRPVLFGAGVVQILLLALLAVVLFLGFNRPGHWFIKRHFRVAGPYVAITTALGLAGGLLVGLSLVLSRVLGLGGNFELDLGLAFGTSTVATVLAALLVFLNRMGWAIGEADRIARDPNYPEDNSLPGEEPTGFPRRTVTQIARARALSEFGRNIDLVLTVPSVVFSVVIGTSFWLAELQAKSPWMGVIAVVVAALMLWAFRKGARGAAAEKKRPMSLVIAVIGVALIAAGWFFNDDVTVAKLGTFGARIAGTGTLLFLGFWARGYFKPEQRRLIAILWDVLTFFPRRFHPLAVRPYAERAVPELTGRLVHHLKLKRKVILSAHSQGTIIGLAALAQISRDDARLGQERLRNVAYVTYGCPLTQLHGRFFPAYFYPELFTDVEGELYNGSITINGKALKASWRNFYRETDYIGKFVEVGANPDDHNQVVPDPPQQPRWTDRPFTPEHDAGPDPPQPIWVGLSLHSFYNSDSDLKEWIAALNQELET